MRKIACVVLFVFLCMSIASAQDTGDTGFYDTGDTGVVLEPEEIQALTSEEIPEYLDGIEDITLLNPYELKEYVQNTYNSFLNIEEAVSGATLTTDGSLINGEFGSRINLNDVPPNALVSLETDGSITIYPKTNGEELDYYALLETNRDTMRAPITIVASDGDVLFTDGTLLHENSMVTLLGENIFYVDGALEYHDLEIQSKSGPVLVFEQEEMDIAAVQKLIEKLDIHHEGRVVFDKDTIFLGDDALVIVRENNEQYSIGAKQGLIFSSKPNGGILYDASGEVPALNMYGQTTVFNGLRVLEVDETGNFYSFRGGWRTPTEEAQMYNKKLKAYYGYTPTSPIEIDISVFEQGEFKTPKEGYELRSGELYNTLGSEDLYVANYLLEDSFDRISKKKAVILWSSAGEEADRSMFTNVVRNKKEQLIAQGYAEDAVEVREFKNQEQFFSILDSYEDLTYGEVVSHGWVGGDGGNIGTEQYFENTDYTDPYRDTYPITSTEITNYFQKRKQEGKSDLFSQEGAMCVISTCHSAALDSFYDPEKGLSYNSPANTPPPTAQTFAQAVGENVVVYGTIGPLYVVAKKDENGKWAKMFVPVADSTDVFEGTANPTTEEVYTQNIVYYSIGE